MPSLHANVKWLYRESGLLSLQTTGKDAWLLIASRCTRMLAYGTCSLVLALFFSALDVSDSRIGLFMTLTLAGDVILSGLLSLVADRLGRRKILLGASLLMMFSGAIFALFENFWILLFAAVVGVISATGSDFGPFRAIEESTLSQLTTPKTRADVLAWYVTTASVGSAIGSEASGRIVHALQQKEGWTNVDAYHTIFWVYSGMGLLNMIFTLLLSEMCEAKDALHSTTGDEDVLLNEMDDDEDISRTNTTLPKVLGNQQKKSMFTQISPETRSIMYKLWFLLIVDSLADGMTGYSFTVYYMDQKFDLSKSTLGDITSISYVLASCSTVFAGSLSRRLGLVNTMVFTHLPSSVAVLLFPAPRGVVLTVALFFLRAGLNNMDQAPRSAFIAAVVKPEERTAVMGITSMLRTLAATAGPTVTGILADHDRFWIAFVAAGALRIAYDLGLWAMFVNMKLYHHENGPASGTDGRGHFRSANQRDEEDGEGFEMGDNNDLTEDEHPEREKVTTVDDD